MLTVCYSAKGGQGCSTVAALLARSIGKRNATLVDAGGDQPALLGIPELPGTEPPLGLYDALVSVDPYVGLALNVIEHGSVGLVAIGRSADVHIPDTAWRGLGRTLATAGGHWILDAGTGPARAALPEADHALLVTRYCYLALRSAHRLAARTTGVVAVRDHGRALQQRDIERTLGAPVVADIPWMPEVARGVDAGLLVARRLPDEVERPLKRLVAWGTTPPAAPPS